MKNIITSCSLKQFEEHIETGILMLQDQLDVPINYYTFGFFVQELNRYIAELEHPRYLAYITGGVTNNEKMLFTVHIGDRFNQEKWVESIEFTYPKDSNTTRVIPPTVKGVGSIVIEKQPRTIVPIPIVENFDYAVITGSKTKGYTKTMRNRRKSVRCKFTNYTEYVNYVSVIFDELSGCTDCLNKTLIDAFLGRFMYPEAFVATGKTIYQHLKLKDDIELNDEIKKNFKIDWEYFINNWDDNAIVIAQYKSADARRTYKGKHKSIDLIEQRVGNFEYVLTNFGKVIWEKVHALLGCFDEDVPEMETEQREEDSAFEKIEETDETDKTTAGDIEVMASPVAAINRLGTDEQLEEHLEKKVEEAKVVHMGYAKCNGCIFLDRHRKWCSKRLGFIDTLVHEECFESERPELEVAPKEEVEKICFNCKRWHSGNNPGNLKAIACRCPVQGRKTLTDHTCAKFVAIIKKED